MLNKETSNSLKIPEYCFRRRNFKGEGELENSKLHAFTDECWDSPRITPNFGDENDNLLPNRTLSRVPRIYSLAEGDFEDFENKPEALKPLFDAVRESSSIDSEITIHAEEYIEPANDGYDYDDDDYDDDDEALTPLASSAARYRLYDIDWDEKLRLKKDEQISNIHEIQDDIKLKDADFCLLDSTGIKGPKEFETKQGKVIISEDGDFSFEFSDRRKLFTVKGGGCFVLVSDVIDKKRRFSGDSSFESADATNQEYNESKYHVSELPQQHLKRYIYGTHLCETIKSFIPKVKLKVPQEGTYFLMSNHLTFADFRAEFISNLSDQVLSAHLTNYQSTVIFTSKSGKRVELDKLILDKMGVFEEVDQAFEEIKYNDYLIKKSHEVSECGIKWSTIIKIWRLILDRLVDCKNLELKGLKAYSESLISSDVDLTLCESFSIGENCMMDWHIKKSVFENIFPIQVEKF
ncbi:unnamed protein product [Cryptosporidium hominis]|uniref:Uncharacterized protein n=1 Tax=Cryptosporidium hominis TaxID=237895 RepID=A0A0S4TA73_CRYHO|nr:hypothetical protein [Cryptosporidium hominis TU502]OLQ18548.1 hypothetical protein ChTU502y2012_411g0125 [Cryptosporidium hominis]PPA63976.1 hypothetical protein ChUKH1_06020 [Cryptosporidium hominis]PPS97134.1 Uncharacterized protein GY17_00001144 [Cryptosporidium hominis]CUV04082.1 unnamed protein product [Cryptosporidium hominis]|eukprot:PPS97134.1 Uncharacterized protein GY17_00001144 [Cryptosporidium hominis]